jgi:hypothetical protein
VLRGLLAVMVDATHFNTRPCGALRIGRKRLDAQRDGNTAAVFWRLRSAVYCGTSDILAHFYHDGNGPTEPVELQTKTGSIFSSMPLYTYCDECIPELLEIRYIAT